MEIRVSRRLDLVWGRSRRGRGRAEGCREGQGAAGPGGCRQGREPGLSQGKGLQDTAGKCQDKVSRCLVPTPCSIAKKLPKTVPIMGWEPTGDPCC